MIELDNEEILRKYDKLVEIGNLHYSKSTVTYLSDRDFHFEFRVTKVLGEKPQLGETVGQDDPKSKEYEEEGKTPSSTKPKSDIDHEDPRYLIAEVGSTHRLILNKFCVFRPQYLLLTSDPTHVQEDPLDTADYDAAWETLSSFRGPHYMIYNCGPEGGSSRRHKHMQVFEGPGQGNLSLLGDRPKDVENAPYLCFMDRIENRTLNTENVARILADIQEQHLRKCREAFGYAADDTKYRFPHNIVMTKDWLMTIPRRQPSIEKLNPVSAAGMIGFLWLTSAEQLQRYKELGPSNVLAEVGIPKEGFGVGNGTKN